MDELLPHYEYELGLMARGLAEFAERHRKIATRIGVRNDHIDDPHTELLTQSFALMAAHLDLRLFDSYPEMTEALLSLTYPHYLRGVPSCAIAQFDPAALFDQITEPLGVPRGTTLDARAAPYRFKTVHDVTLAPLSIQTARYAPTTLAPTTARLPADATGILSITFASLSPLRRFDWSASSDSIRLHLRGERPVVAALTDTMLLRATGAFVEVDQSGHWLPLSKVPFEAVGFADEERLLPAVPGNPARSFQYLLEYFAFPELFDFIDVDLGRIRRAARTPEARMLTLHVVLRDTPDESAAAQMLGRLDARAFQLFCTPVINLFSRPALPVKLTAAGTVYPITPEPLEKGPAPELYSVDAVYLGERTDAEKKEATSVRKTPRVVVPPYQALGHHPTDADPYWLAFRDPDATLKGTGNPWRLSLVGLEGRPAPPHYPQLDIDTTATNGDLPSQLPVGHPQGDLLNEAIALSCPIALLTRPTPSAALPRGGDALWRVLSMLSPHPVDLSQEGLKGLQEFLRLHAPRSMMVAQRSIDALTGLDYKPAMRWMALGFKIPSFVRGIEIMLSIDETALRDVTLSTFARVLDRLFRPYAPENSYVQLIILSAQTGAELLRCDTQPGTRPLL